MPPSPEASSKEDLSNKAPLKKETQSDFAAPQVCLRSYRHYHPLRYGANPHQSPAGIYLAQGTRPPFEILNGEPGWINLLDALNGWQLVRELQEALGLPAAASFKHVSPAGAAVGILPLEPALAEVCEAPHALTPLAAAYLRARGADAQSSYGDFAAFSATVDLPTAQLLRQEVSDGVIAPGYTEEALALLRTKKTGRYLILRADTDWQPEPMEHREIYGVMLRQPRNMVRIDPQQLGQVVTQAQTLSAAARRDLALAALTMKYTQSNSVGYALNGQMIGVGAGQQSRIACTRLAGEKAQLWWLKQHPRMLELPFRAQLRRMERINARAQMWSLPRSAQPEWKQLQSLFTHPVAPPSAAERTEWLRTLQNVSLASDAFFPFRDNIDEAAACGVQYILQPGGSRADTETVAACDTHGLVMIFSGQRLFHH